MNMKKLIEVKLTYFKPSGKYYTDGSFYISADTMYWEILGKVRHWNFYEEHMNQPLPGLSSNTWDGYILVIPQSDELKIPAVLNLREVNE